MSSAPLEILTPGAHLWRAVTPAPASEYAANPLEHALDVSELERRSALCHEPVTLNGRPATLSGARLRFAVVRTLGGCDLVEWSWDAAARIVRAGGRFAA